MLFGKEKNKNLTDNFIKSALQHANEKFNLDNISIQSEVSLEKLFLNDKQVRLDIVAEYDQATVCIEMQNKNEYNIYERARCYAMKIGALQLKSGQDYLKLKPLIMIVILNYIPKDHIVPGYFENIINVNEKFRDIEIKIGIKFIFIFLPNFKDNTYLLPDNQFAQWLKFLQFNDKEVIEFMGIGNENIKKANDEVLQISAEEEERRMNRFYEMGELELHLTRRDGYLQGEADGIAKGKVEGKAEGLIKGKLEALLELAQQMLAKNYNIEEIMSLTGLSKKELHKLAKIT